MTYASDGLDADIDHLLAAYCEGLYAMDSRTTFPFWDYDMAPLYSEPWIAKVLTAVDRAAMPLDLPGLFGGPSVPRKELIYSLVDLKVAGVPRADRLRLVSFWVDLLRTWCGEDWASTGANRVLTEDQAHIVPDMAHWMDADREAGRAVGRIVVTLNALAYGLYSDVFVHQCAECRGPYSLLTSDRQQILVRSWSALWPQQLRPDAENPGCEQVVIAANYEDCQCSIDIYNHVSWSAPPVDHLVRYAVWVDGVPQQLNAAGLTAMAHRFADLAQSTFRRYQGLDFEATKALWVRQRNYQFRSLFAYTGLPVEAPEMIEAVRGKPLERSPLWNMTLPKERLFEVWTACLDPRTEIYAEDWPEVFARVFGDQSRR